MENNPWEEIIDSIKDDVEDKELRDRLKKIEMLKKEIECIKYIKSDIEDIRNSNMCVIKFLSVPKVIRPCEYTEFNEKEFIITDDTINKLKDLIVDYIRNTNK